MSVLEGVSNFFQFIYSHLVYSWNLWSLLVITVGFFVIQIVFIVFYTKIFKIVFRIVPIMKYYSKKMGL